MAVFGNNKAVAKHSGSTGTLDTIIANACHITGDIVSKSSITIDGRVDGNVTSEGTVVIQEKGYICGNIKCNELIVYGSVDGQIVSQTLHLQPTSKITGDINTQNLHVEPGAVYQGSVSMHKNVSDTKKSISGSTMNVGGNTIIDASKG